MTTRTIDYKDVSELQWKLIDGISAQLRTETDLVRRQQIIEFMIVRHAMGVGNVPDACMVIDAIAKHCKQFVTQNTSMLIDGKHGGRFQ